MAYKSRVVSFYEPTSKTATIYFLFRWIDRVTFFLPFGSVSIARTGHEIRENQYWYEVNCPQHRGWNLLET